jgi:Cu2+-containing amine oxidase
MFVLLKISSEGVLMSFVPLSKLIRSISTVLVLLLWVSSDAVAQRKSDFTEALDVAKVSAPLTSEERTLATRLAEQALKSNRLFTDRKMYLTEARIHRDSASEERGVFERMAVLTYYRYEGDLSIQVFINLAGQRVFGVKQFPNFPPPLSADEYELAKELALSHPQLKDELAPSSDRLVVEALTTRSGSPQDPLFRHRVVYLLFRVGQRYLIQQWMVFVDLTTEKVILKPVPRRMKM